MNRRGLLSSLMSLVPACFVSAKSSPATNPPVVLIDENGRYLSMPAVGTSVRLPSPFLCPFDGVYKTAADHGIVVRGTSEWVYVVTRSGHKSYFSNGQVHMSFYGRVVYFHREPMFLTSKDCFKCEYGDVYPGEPTMISQEVFQEKFNAS